MYYQFIAQRSPGIILLNHVKYGQQIWTIGKIRKVKLCRITGENLKGKVGWMPVTNKSNRMDRISEEGMKELILTK